MAWERLAGAIVGAFERHSAYLLAYGVSAGARRAKATVGGENYAQKACGWWAHERQSAERCKVRRGRVRAIKRALERHEAVDMRMHRERARTAL